MFGSFSIVHCSKPRTQTENVSTFAKSHKIPALLKKTHFEKSLEITNSKILQNIEKNNVNLDLNLEFLISFNVLLNLSFSVMVSILTLMLFMRFYFRNCDVRIGFKRHFS